MPAHPPARVGLAVAVALTALGGCGVERHHLMSDAECELAMNAPDSAEASDWLKDPYGEKRLGSFSRDQGLGLAAELEARGAVRTVAVGIKNLGGPEPLIRARGLILVLPDDPAKRRALFTLHAQQVRGQGFEAVADTEQKYLEFPWNE